MAPDGSAWLALYPAPAEKDKVVAHLKNVAFADGEDVTYLRGARDWLAVSGLKGDRVYYRKAALTCGGTLWRHIAFEYRAEQKPMLDRVVERAAQAFDQLAEGILQRRCVHAPEELGPRHCERSEAIQIAATAGLLRRHASSAMTNYSAGATVASCWPDLFQLRPPRTRSPSSPR